AGEVDQSRVNPLDGFHRPRRRAREVRVSHEGGGGRADDAAAIVVGHNVDRVSTILLVGVRAVDRHGTAGTYDDRAQRDRGAVAPVDVGGEVGGRGCGIRVGEGRHRA